MNKGREGNRLKDYCLTGGIEMLADYHLRFEFIYDSRTPMEQQIERAIELGACLS